MASLRPRPQVMRLTDAAANRIKEILGKAERPIAGVRVGVKNGGCAGMSYTMEYAESAKPLDEVVEDKGVKLLIDPKAVPSRNSTALGSIRRRTPLSSTTSSVGLARSAYSIV